MNKLILLLFLIPNLMVNSQSFAPAAGQIGSTAIHKDSSVIVNWASGIFLTRGYLNISNPSLGLATYGSEINALGYAEGDGMSVVSLGDGGVATLTFTSPIINLTGPDFAIFENGFADNYMEFAHVEVSSDGINFFRFPSISETPTDAQISNVMFGDCRYIYNLAGKYRQGFGTPFDLEELISEPGLDVNSVTHVRIIDVVGSINPTLGTIDGQGNVINDPYPTEFESGGFDLDGIAVLHEMPAKINEESLLVRVFPNPSNGVVTIKTNTEGSIQILNVLGQEVYSCKVNQVLTLDMKKFGEGVMFVTFEVGGDRIIEKIVVGQ